MPTFGEKRTTIEFKRSPCAFALAEREKECHDKSARRIKVMQLAQRRRRASCIHRHRPRNHKAVVIKNGEFSHPPAFISRIVKNRQIPERRTR